MLDGIIVGVKVQCPGTFYCTAKICTFEQLGLWTAIAAHCPYSYVQRVPHQTGCHKGDTQVVLS